MLGDTSFSASPSNSSATTTMRDGSNPTSSSCTFDTSDFHTPCDHLYFLFRIPHAMNKSNWIQLETHTHHLKHWTLNKKVKQVERGEVGMGILPWISFEIHIACTFIPSCFTQAISMVLLFGPMLVCKHGQLLLNFWQWGITNKNFGSSVVHMQWLQNCCPIICNHDTMTSPSWLQNFFHPFWA